MHNGDQEINRIESVGPSIAERYKLLIEARNFHYDNFSKWVSYFYVAIGALFVAYYSISATDKIEANEKHLLSMVVLILGYVTSMLWYWSTKGYYYWNINFIMLVNHYEYDIFKWYNDERVYTAFANKDTQDKPWKPWAGANISTSKVAIIFAYIVTVTWGFLLFYNILVENNLCLCCNGIGIFAFIISNSLIILLSVFFAPYLLNSKIDHYPDLKLKQTEVMNIPKT